jgi:hypothetical protein
VTSVTADGETLKLKLAARASAMRSDLLCDFTIEWSVMEVPEIALASSGIKVEV